MEYEESHLVQPEVPFEEYFKQFDTELTPEQRNHVESLKKKITGGTYKSSPYRDIQKAEEVEGTGNFLPRVAENARELIDYALSHIPKRGGPRRSRHKKRVLAREEQRMADREVKKIQKRKAEVRKLEKMRRSRALAKKFREMAVEINAGRMPSSGPELYALHPCSYPSLFPNVKGNSKRVNKSPLLPRNYRLPPEKKQKLKNAYLKKKKPPVTASATASAGSGP